MKMKRLWVMMIAVVMLLTCLSGCGTGTESRPTTPPDPTTPMRSESGHFYGLPCGEEDFPPALQHRTEAEIATGLTAQDVLNAFDQFTIDVIRATYTVSPYTELVPEEVLKNAVAQFDKITTWSKRISNGEILIEAPFYWCHPQFTPWSVWQTYESAKAAGAMAVYQVTVYYTAYVDGVCFETEIGTAGVDKECFETAYPLFNNTSSKVLDQETLMDMVGEERYYEFDHAVGKEIYEPIVFSRESIMSATPEQLEALYKMIQSMRIITFEQRLPADGEIAD